MGDSLINPSWFSRQSQGVKAIVVLGGLLILLGAVLFLLAKCDNYLIGRDIKKARENVNVALQQVNAAKGTVANDRVDEAVALHNVNAAVQDVITASNATDQAKAEANAAAANYIAAKKAGIPTGTTEADLDAKLRALGE